MTRYIKPYTILFLLFLILNSCGIYRPVDSRVIPVNEKERVKQNIEQGKGIKLGNPVSRGGDFQFASANPMWRASLDILDFLPLVNADYSGGIIITDWYSPKKKENESIKITVRFLSNEIRPDGLEILIFKKNCKVYENCEIISSKNNLSSQIKLAILKKAAELEKTDVRKQPRGKVLKETPIIETPWGKKKKKKKK